MYGKRVNRDLGNVSPCSPVGMWNDDRGEKVWRCEEMRLRSKRWSIARPTALKQLVPAGRGARRHGHLSSDCIVPEGFVLRWCNGQAEECTRLKCQRKRQVELCAAVRLTNRCMYKFVRFGGLPSGPSAPLGPLYSALGALRNRIYRCYRRGLQHSKHKKLRLRWFGCLPKDTARIACQGWRTLRVQFHYALEK
jgi:hypothetical protein